MTVKQTTLSQEADRCVKCGLCLPHCPTYKLSKNESDSPRGRISLIQAVTSGQLDISDAQPHLDECLNCRACELACPSGVKYGQLIDQIRTYQENDARVERSNQLFSSLNKKRALKALVRGYANSPLRSLVRFAGSNKLKQLDSLLPSHIAPTFKPEPKPKKSERQIALFTGCVSGLLEQNILRACVKVLEHCGYQVLIPDQQVCCGAIHQHNGNIKEARRLGEENRAAFDSLKVEAIITYASGCGAQLSEYGETAEKLAHPVMDISEFLINHSTFNAQALLPLNRTIMLHTPCTLKNVLRTSEATQQLVESIPQLEVIQPPDDDCCGSAGTLMLTKPELAKQLRDPIIRSLADQQTELVATSNTGCAMHLRSGIKAAALTCEVIHPIELIAQQLPDNASGS